MRNCGYRFSLPDYREQKREECGEKKEFDNEAAGSRCVRQKIKEEKVSLTQF